MFFYSKLLPRQQIKNTKQNTETNIGATNYAKQTSKLEKLSAKIRNVFGTAINTFRWLACYPENKNDKCGEILVHA